MSRPLRAALPLALSLAATALLPATAAAQSAAAAQGSGTFVGELVSIVVPLAFIILILFAVLHFARRRYGMTAQDAPLSVVQILPVGPRERIVLVKTRGGRVFAVGVAGQAVNLLTDLDPADLIAPASTGSPVEPSSVASKVGAAPLTIRDLFGRRRSSPGS